MDQIAIPGLFALGAAIIAALATSIASLRAANSAKAAAETSGHAATTAASIAADAAREVGQINERSARAVVEINVEAERQRDRREWRKKSTAPVQAELDRYFALFRDLSVIDVGAPESEYRAPLAEFRKQRFHHVSFPLLASGNVALTHAMAEFVRAERDFREHTADEFELTMRNPDTDTSDDLMPEVERFGIALFALYRAIENYIYEK